MAKPCDSVSFSNKHSRRIRRSGWRRILTGILLLAGGIPGALCRVAAEPKSELTLSEFRALVREQSPQASQERAWEVFSRLLAAQGNKAAARQSLDRLSGWHKAVQARFQAQNAPALDVELLRFSEAKAAASVAQFEAERREALREANFLLKRPPNSALVALMEANQSRDQTGSPAGAAPDGVSCEGAGADC